MDDISDWRKHIDEIDEKILELLNERTKCVIEIGKIKSKNNLQVYDSVREKNIISHLRENNSGPLSDDAVQRLFECLITESKKLEEK